MQTLLYADEVRAFSEIPIPDAEVREAEVNLAKQLVDQIASETFNPADYQDEVRKRIMADIERKVAGKEIATAPAAAETGRVIDLMEALKASLGEGSRPAKATTSLLERRPARRATMPAQVDASVDVKPESRKRASRR
jgi:DNA end-binding protein Ku